jgi:hypothetical protein
VVISRLSVGQRARVTIPALADRALDGEVVQVAGVGRDKFERPEYAGRAGFADVVDFEARVRLLATQGVELRQGMAVRVEVQSGVRSGILRLPLAALRRAGTAWQATRTDGRMVEVVGEPVGPLWFAVSGGLVEGDAVFIERTRNR